MTTRPIFALALALIVGARAAQSQTDANARPPRPEPIDIPSLAFPRIDAATLASLSARLERLARDSSLLSALSPSEPRMYALFRELEAAQQRFAIALTAPDSTGQTLYDRLRAMTARNDSLFRELEARHRQAPRP